MIEAVPSLPEVTAKPISLQVESRSEVGHIPALDGVRGLAVLLVMLFHLSMVPAVGRCAEAWYTFTQFGGLGVDIFFVLSGFLITGILRTTRGEPRYFRNFYARRILRIFPLYYAVVFFSLCVLPHLAPWTTAKFGPVNRDGIWYWLHLSNFAIARRGAFVHGILDVSWSLAIEEQFYLFWPAVVALASPRMLRWTCIVLISVSCVSRLVLTLLSASPVAVYTLTFCRLDGLAMGGLVLLAVRSLNEQALRAWVSRGLLLVGCVSIWLLVPLAPLSPIASAAVLAALLHLLVATATGCAILAIHASPPAVLLRWFRWAPLRALGRYSYGLYLFHYPIAALTREKMLRPGRTPIVLGSSLPSQFLFYSVAGGAAFFAARLSWSLYEKRFLRLKRFFV
jgi:peptidoglycan/LPS O-acetylase OafA/YrhL